jgi:hypothetical protein
MALAVSGVLLVGCSPSGNAGRARTDAARFRQLRSDPLLSRGYPGSELVGSSDTPPCGGDSGGGIDFLRTYIADAATPSVFDFYRTQFRSDGWGAEEPHHVPNINGAWDQLDMTKRFPGWTAKAEVRTAHTPVVDLLVFGEQTQKCGS